MGTVTSAVVELTVQSTAPVPSSAFTKISADGRDLPDNAITWACVRQRSTGLIWEANITQTMRVTQHPCPANAAATCYGFTNLGDGRMYDASTVPASVGSLCGKTGWRLPTLADGQALTNDAAYSDNAYVAWKTWFGTEDKAILGWTSSPLANDPTNAWAINFPVGNIQYNLRAYGGNNIALMNVRLVQGVVTPPGVTPTTGLTKVSDAGQDLPDDATTWECVRQNSTGMMWEAHVRRGIDATGNWISHQCPFEATHKCAGYSNLNNGDLWDAPTVATTIGRRCGRTGWRLPTAAEAEGLVRDPVYYYDGAYSASISYRRWFGTDDTAFSGWTSSYPSSQAAYFVDFSDGTVNLTLRYDMNYVRLVAP